MSRASSGPVPFARLASCYFFFFANVGIFLPYWSLYLQSLGLSPARIGELLAVAMATRLVAPYLWGWLVDVTGRPLAAVRGGCWVSLLAFAGVWWAEASPWALGAVLLCYSFFWNAILAPLEVVTLRHLKDQTQRYGAIRSWGSVGFVVFATGYGWLLPTLGPMGVPWAMALTIVALGIMGATVPTAPGEFVRGGGVGGTNLKTVLARREVVALLLVSVLVQASHGPLYGFLTIHLEGLGYSGGFIGFIWAVGVVAEIGIFLLMPQLMAAHSPRRLLLVALFLTALRWGLMPLCAPWPWALLLVQTLHAASFGINHAVAIELIQRHFAGRLHGRGQALYSCLSFGVGGMVGSLMAGYAWEATGPGGSYGLAAALAVGALGVARWGMVAAAPGDPLPPTSPTHRDGQRAGS